MNKINYYKNIYVNYVFTFTEHLDVRQGIWMLFLASKGLNLFEIGLLEGVFHVTSLIMETPTGAVADLFGRKTSRLIGVILSIVASVLMIVASNFLVFAISFAVCALSYNFESGANEALIYDSLLLEHKENRYMKIAGNNEVIYQATSIIALIVGGMIGNIQYTLVFYLAIVLSIITLFVGLFFKEPVMDDTKHKIKLLPAMKKQYVDSFHAIKENSRLFYLILFTSILSASVTLSFFYLQIAWKNEQLSTLGIGVYLAISSFAAAVGAFFANRIEKKFGENFIIRVVPIIVTICIFALSFIDFALIPFCIMSILETIIFVATRDYINKIISSDKRATILSFESVIFSLIMIIIFPLFGLISDHISIKNTFILFGALMLIMSLINLRKRHRR